MVATQLALLLCALILFHDSNSNTKVASGLRITSIEVPSAVMNSSPVVLVCNYELQGDQLYSVKWYKNYVEFYRFQPSGGAQTHQPPPASRDLSQQQQQQQQQPTNFGSKQEFELDGINVNLSTSNATHVHLKQTSLASEGTYKCEVSADAPSFATISSERQMKVYVLPRQKLSIVDNTKLNSNQQPTDLINFTCVSAPSRPAARLQWFINDTPIANSSKWLLQHGAQQPAFPPEVGQVGPSPASTKLGLSFRLQPHVLAQMMNSAPVNSSTSQSNFFKTLPTNRQQLEFKCLAELQLEFVSETSIAVAGGKTTQLKRRNRDHPGSVSPRPSPLVGRPQVGGQDLDQPRPIDSAQQHPQTAGVVVRLRVGSEPRPLAANNQTTASSGVAPVRHQQQSQQPQQGVPILTVKQLRSKADQIEQLLRQTKPNDLQPPLIEAKIQVLDYADLEVDQTSGGSGDDVASEDRSSMSDETSPRVVESADSALQSDSHAAAGDDDDTSDKDYQLNDLVLFTCSLQPPEQANLRSNVQFKWLINDKEISSNHINHYDGSRFLLQPADQRSARRKQQQQQQTNQSPSQLQLEQQQQQQQQQETKQSSLLLEFTPSLFQLKELDLKCRTSVEQPLIEYETTLVSASSANSQTTVAAAPGYIEAEQSAGSENMRGHRPWATRQSHQQRRNQVLRLQKQQQQQSSSSSSPSLVSFSPLQQAAFLLNILVVVVVAAAGQTMR